MASIITPSTTYDNNLTQKTYLSKLIADSLTDGVATFSGGTIVNLVPPTDPQDAITKGIVDGSLNAAAPVNSVQFNNITFGGSANLTFVPNTLTVNGSIKDGSGIDITGGVISGLDDPTSGTEIATKNYVDSFSSMTNNSYIQSDIGVTYTPVQMINGIILRNLVTDNDFGVSLTDTTPTATQLVAFVPTASVGYAAKLKIMNENPNSNGTTIEGRDGFTLTIAAGSGVTFFPSGAFKVNRGYVLDAYIVFTNIVTPAVTIIITSCGFSGLTLYLAPSNTFLALNNRVSYVNYSAMQNTGNVIWNTTNNAVTSNTYSYTTSDIKNQLVIRNPSGIATDTLGSSIDFKYLNQIITIQNISAFLITISGQTDIWTLVPDPITIPTTYQLLLSLDSTIPLITDGGSYYNVGSYNTTGGTGTGMTVTVSNLITTSTLTVAGSGYTTGNLTTTNLTTPSATGLIINCTSVGGSGDISVYGDIVNYLSGGYLDGDIIQINGGNGAARIQLTKVNSVNNYFINTIGDGAYVSTDVINISGPGTGSGAQFTLGTFIYARTIGRYAI